MHEHKFDQREGSIYHVDSPDGHRYFIISDREFTDCGKASEYRYVHECRCDACTDAHTAKARFRRKVAAARRRRREAPEGQGHVSEANVWHRDRPV